MSSTGAVPPVDDRRRVHVRGTLGGCGCHRLDPICSQAACHSADPVGRPPSERTLRPVTARTSCSAGSSRLALRQPSSALGGLGGLRRTRPDSTAPGDSAAFATSRASPRSARRESTTITLPPSATAATGTGRLVRRKAVVAASIAIDQDATAVAKGTVARFHGSSVSGTTTKICRPGLPRIHAGRTPRTGCASAWSGRMRSKRDHPGAPDHCPRSHLHDSTSGPIGSRPSSGPPDEAPWQDPTPNRFVHGTDSSLYGQQAAVGRVLAGQREWTNSRVIEGGLVDFVRDLKGGPGGDRRSAAPPHPAANFSSTTAWSARALPVRSGPGSSAHLSS